MAADNAYSSIRRNLEILRTVAGGTNRFDEIKDKVDLPASTINRILKGLVSVGMSYQDPENRHYYLGPEILKLLANPLATHEIMVSICQEEMERLTALSGETTVLFAALGIKRILLATIPSPNEVTLLYRPGLTNFIHLASGGKMLLAMMDWQRIGNILTAIEMILKEQGEELDKPQILKDLNEIKEQGYAISRGEWLKDCNGLSVPLWGYAIPVVLGMMGPDYRVDIMTYRDEIQKSGQLISNIIGRIFPH